MLAIALAPGRAGGAELYSDNGLELRWDNSLRYSLAARIEAPSAAILANPNSDDGDRDFAAGVISSRFDLLSQLDVGEGDLGFHASAAAWYDTAYQRHTDNMSQATYNAEVPVGRFAPAVRTIYGQYAELSDAFLYDTVSLDDVPVSIRAGRQTLLWGESLFFDPDSIASALVPVDYTRLTTGQDSYSNNVYLPVTQLVLTAQFSPNVTLTVYDQFEARSSRETGDGSYLSYLDFIGPGATRLFLSSSRYLSLDDEGTVSAAGQAGAALHASLGEADFGFYALEYNAKDPVLTVAFAQSPQNVQAAGFYGLIYAKHIVLYGLSASTALGDGTIAGEISLRENAPLLIYAKKAGGGVVAQGYVDGDLVHIQASTRQPLGRSDLWETADLSAEIAADQVTGTESPAAMDRFGMRARMLFEPHYFQVLPNLDLTLPITLGYNFAGLGFSYYEQNEGTGDFQLGVSALYRSAWKASLMLTGFIGTAQRQPLADRNFISLSLERSF